MDSPRKITKNVGDKDVKSIIHQSSTIADLPETIVHHIASLLSLKDMARMSTCLKPWRYLCYTCQYLTVDVDKFCGYKMRSIIRFVRFMERMLRFPRELQLERFTLTCRTVVSDRYIINWVRYAVECSVKELDLNIVLQPFEIPDKVFTLESLRILKLHANYRDLKLPPCLRLTNLHTLTFLYVRFPDDPFAGLILEKCISLETLTLSYCFGFSTLNITSLSLKTLRICDAKKSQLCHLNISCQNLTTLYLDLDYHAQISFELSAPALQSFRICFSNAVACCWSPLKSLQEAVVSVSTCNDWNDAYPFGSQLLAYLTTAKELHLCGMLMQVLAWMMKENPSFSLCNINYLKLHTCMSDDETLLIMYLLRRFPNLQALVISQETYHYNNKPLHREVCDEDGDIRNAEIVYHLKGVTMSLLGSGENNLELAKCLLNNLKVLEELRVLYAPSDNEKAEKFGQEINNIQKASLDVKIIMEPCDDEFYL
ncbi:hypothetical protein ACHQM5_027721 [Ranunculus cassubicifolius]